MLSQHLRRQSLALLMGMLCLTATFAIGLRPVQLALPVTRPQTQDQPSVLTDAHGHFRFDRLHSSSHVLRVDMQTLPPGLRPSDSQVVLTLSPGVTLTRAVAPGVLLRATYRDDGTAIEGLLFRDLDGDQQPGVGEPGLAGVRVIDPDVYQYFVPFSDPNLKQSFNDVLDGSCLNLPSTDDAMDSRVALTASSNGTIVYYDHWDDGYDADPTVPGPTTLVITLNAGQVTTLHESSTDVHNPPFDGRDRITIIGQPVAAVRAAWLNDPGTRLAGAWEMPKVSDWGRHYVIPIGEDIGQRGSLSFGDYDYVSAEVMAAYDGTVVQIDANADGVFETSVTLNAGQTYYLRGSATQVGFAIHSGAQIDSSLPVQVQVRAGNCRAPYSGRSYTLVPVERWANEYWSPVSSFYSGVNRCRVRYLVTQPNASADVDIYIFNPGASALPVTYEDASGTGVISIPARSTASYLNLHPSPLVRSNTQGVHLTAPGPFSAVAAVDSTALGNDGADFDWSYTLVPAQDLSAQAVLSWAPGTAANPPANTGSTVYVQATRDGTLVFADLTGDGLPDKYDTDGNGTLSTSSAYGYNENTSDQGILLNKGQMVRVSNPTTHDMTGARIFAQDNNHQLAVVWGEDACIANAISPYLDLGYTVLPLPIPELNKTTRLAVDADHSGDISPGDTLEYSIRAYNNGVGPMLDVAIVDTLPFTYTSFLVGSLTSVPPAAPPPGVSYDNGSGTFTYVPAGPPGAPDPQVHAFRATYPSLAAGAEIVITFRVQIHPTIPASVRSFDNFVLMNSSNTPAQRAKVSTPINQVDLLIHKTDGVVNVQPPDQLTYTLTYTNAGPGIAYNVVMTDTLPPLARNVTTPYVPGVITPTIEADRIIFQLGTLPAGYVGRTTVTLTMDPNTPPGPFVNTVVISTSSSETNTGNNSSSDIDIVPRPTAVVLSELAAERWPGGVLVRWRTLAEQDSYGFRVYRGSTPDRASATLLTSQIIPGQGRGRSGGMAYSFFDAGAPAGRLYYWLEDIDLHGLSSFHGPAAPQLQAVRSMQFLPLVRARP